MAVVWQLAAFWGLNMLLRQGVKSCHLLNESINLLQLSVTPGSSTVRGAHVDQSALHEHKGLTVPMQDLFGKAMKAVLNVITYILASYLYYTTV